MIQATTKMLIAHFFAADKGRVIPCMVPQLGADKNAETSSERR